MKTSTSPRYDMTVNPAYQIDYSSSSSGKKVSGTKRRVRWRFGFSSLKAIESGCTGVDCRGEEHEVTLSWSLASGKRMVVADGVEVHFSVGKKTQGRFECTWPMQGGHQMRIIANATPNLRASPGYRQFELFLDGNSIFDLPRIFELGGGAGAIDRPVSSRRASQARRQFQAQSQLQREEDMAWAHKIDDLEGRRMMERSASMSIPSHRHSAAERSMSVHAIRTVSLPEDLVSEPTPVAETQDLVSSPLPILNQNPFDAHPQPSHYATNQAPTYDQVASTIMSTYATPSPAPATPSNQSFVTAEIKSQGEQSPACVIAPANHGGVFFPQGAPTPVAKPPPQVDYTSTQTVSSDMTNTMTPSPNNTPQPASPELRSSVSGESLEDIVEKEEEKKVEKEVPMDDLQKSFHKLVNIDDIRSDPDEVVNVKLTMAPTEEPKSTTSSNGTSRGLPPTPTAWHMGENATLSQIQRVKTPRSSSTTNVMRNSLSDSTNSIAAAAAAAAAAVATPPPGQMVVYGSTPSPANGPPPITRVQGFGIGAQVTHDGVPAPHPQVMYPPQHPQAAYAGY